MTELTFFLFVAMIVVPIMLSIVLCIIIIYTAHIRAYAHALARPITARDKCWYC